MKKTLALVLAIMMVMTMSVTAWASEVDTSPKKLTGENQSAIILVEGTYNGSETTEHVISVVISWEAMTFTYNASSTHKWNPDTHSYVTTTGGSWANESKAITVVNHSDVTVEASFAFDAVDGITGSFTAAEETGFENNKFAVLPPAIGSEQGDAPSKTVNFSITGGTISAEKTALGNISVTIGAYTVASPN